MTTTLETPATLQCACPGYHCKVAMDTPFRSGSWLFCSEACVTGHPNHEPCHAGCGCECQV